MTLATSLAKYVVSLATSLAIYVVSQRKWQEMWQESYTTTSIGQDNCPKLYLGLGKESPRQKLKNFCKDHELKINVSPNGAPPQWMIHKSASWKKRSDFDHFRSAFSGIVDNDELFTTINVTLNDDLRIQAEVICGNGEIMKRKEAVVVESLSISSTLCLASYDYAKSSSDTKLKFGRCASMLSSNTHAKAAIIGYKIAPPTMFPADGPPWPDGVDEVGSNCPVDLEVTIMFRGSESAADWITNFAFRLSDTKEEASLPRLRTHSGFLNRHKRMWPCILDDIRRIQKNIQGLGHKLNRIRFALGGHSQGGALSTLTALALSKEFPESPIRLFTFSTPAIFEQDPLTNTCIRHIRFAVDNDFVPMRWLGRQHGGSRCITINGKRAGLNPVRAHYMEKYKTFIDQICNGDFTSIA